MKILLRLPNWLGDVVMSTAFVNAVVELYPGAEIDVIIKKELGGIAALIPGINNIHLFSKQDHNGLGGAYRFGKSLRTEKYDLYFNLPFSLSSSVLAYATGAKKRIGYAKEGGLFMLTNAYKRPANGHRVDDYLFLLEKFTGKKIIDKRVKLNVAIKSNQYKDTVLINFNSEAESRRMPLDKGLSILNLLTTTFLYTRFAFIGAPKEAAFIDQFIEQANNKERLENLAGKTDLAGLCTLISSVRAILTTDSGPAHLANSLGTPTIVLFGAGNEHNTAPYNKQDLTVLRDKSLSCEPCVRNTCKLYGKPKCMELLDEVQIIAALSVYLQNA